MNTKSYPLLTHCPICHSLYATEDVKLIEQKEDAKLYHSFCHNCGHGLLAYVLEVAGGISSIGLITDASGTDMVRLAEYQAISGDECVGAHRLILENSRGLCQRLLDISGKLA
ncbi:MAG: hypothetical protein PHC70_03465 [Patescibacteria group bacterium]|nr:hypothetical protein [Patescibacteria group bacterium]